MIYIRFSPSLGRPITKIIDTTLETANRYGRPVRFRFNDIECESRPGDTGDDVFNRWQAACKAKKTFGMSIPKWP